MRRVLILGSLVLGGAQAARADGTTITGITAVSSRVYNGYARARLPDGTMKPETYVFGNGGFLTAGAAGGETPGAQRDETIDGMDFDSIARAMQGPLAGQSYALTQDPNATSLLVMVFWGTTVGGYSEHKGKFRDLLNLKNAKLLGFDSESVLGQDYGNNIRSNILKELHSQMMDALQVSRYFVVLRAFDFQSSWKEKKIKLLWETRFSINQRRNAFDEALPLMAQYASQSFGVDSGGLQMARIANGHVEVGDIKSLGDVSPPPK
jgi:hypothetical protein